MHMRNVDRALTGVRSTVHLTKQRSQEEERERRMDYVPEESAVSTKQIQVWQLIAKPSHESHSRTGPDACCVHRWTLTPTTCSKPSTCPTCQAWRRSR